MVGKLTSPKRVLSLKRREIALALRLQGYTYHEIGKRLKISHVSAWQHVKSAMEEHRKALAEDVEQVRDMEVNRLDGMLEKLYPRRKDPRTADTILRLMDRRSKLLGLDVPNKVDVNVTGLEKLSDEELVKKAEAVFRRSARKSAEEAERSGEGSVDPDDSGGAEEA